MSDCPCCSEPWVLGEQSAEGDTPWNGASKFYLYVGTVTATIATSQAFTITGFTRGHSWDGTDTYLTETNTSGAKAWLRRYSGQFTSTVRSSLDVWSVANSIDGICWAGSSTYWQEEAATRRFIETSGKFTSTLRQSVSIATRDHQGITVDGTDTWTFYEPFGGTSFKWLQYSGQFTSTLKTSTTVSSTHCEYDLTYDGSRAIASVDSTPLSGGGGRFFVYSGFSSTVTSSASWEGVDQVFGVNSNNSITG